MICNSCCALQWHWQIMYVCVCCVSIYYHTWLNCRSTCGCLVLRTANEAWDIFTSSVSLRHMAEWEWRGISAKKDTSPTQSPRETFVCVRIYDSVSKCLVMCVCIYIYIYVCVCVCHVLCFFMNLYIQDACWVRGNEYNTMRMMYDV